MMRKKIKISGMNCSACARLIEFDLAKTHGIAKVNINYASEHGLVDYNEKVISKDDIVNKIKKLGYFATDDFSDNNQAEKIAERKQFMRLIISLFLSLPLAFFMLVNMFGWLPMFRPYFAIVSLLLATPIQFIIGAKFYKSFWSALKIGTFNMDSLIAIGTTTAFAYSLLSYFIYFLNYQSFLINQSAPELYFETSAFLITFVLLGKYLEKISKNKMTNSIKKLVQLQAKNAHVKKDGQIFDLPIEQIKINDIVVVRPGEIIPVDGVVLFGQAIINEAMLTGESLPKEKNINDKVFAGTSNGLSAFEFKVTKVGQETVLAQIIKLVDEAQSSKAPIQQLADKIASWFVPAIIISALVTFIVWYFILSSSITFALMAFMSVIVIACPCALGLATPTALIAGIGWAADRGLLIKGGEPLQIASRIKAIVFDKTGTITSGAPEVSEIINFSQHNEQELLNIVYSIESLSEHPLAAAVVAYAKKRQALQQSVSDFKSLTGFGVQAKVAGQLFYLGGQKLITEKINASQVDWKKINELANNGKTIIILADRTNILLAITIVDTVKHGASSTIESLKKMGMDIYMLTGDNYSNARIIADQIGIKQVIADILPSDKLSEVKKIQKNGSLAFVGDGINDAPALAQSDLSIVMSSGSDIAIETGSIIIMNNDLNSVIKIIQIAKKTMNKIKQNLFFALIYNVVGIPLAAGVFITYGLSLRPEIAGLAMILSSLSVVINSLSIKRFVANNYLLK
jgi:Cu+-exporting ATPase